MLADAASPRHPLFPPRLLRQRRRCFLVTEMRYERPRSYAATPPPAVLLRVAESAFYKFDELPPIEEAARRDTFCESRRHRCAQRGGVAGVARRAARRPQKY